MTNDELAFLRRGMKFTQTEMADRLGLSIRAYSMIEVGNATLRPIHILAVERVAIDRAVELANPMIAPAGVRNDALLFAEMVKGIGDDAE
jgi:transcriptional regulator with XRE-family HTH domain